ncbi:MAG: hypothetical protein KKH28_14435 [Elusimicrobia bacterium]|nr:hypothetical protein [Elusimicrobiota bacterium]
MEDKKVVAVGIKFFAAAAGLAVLAYWLVSLYPSFTKNREMLKEIEPVLREAKSLGLDYDTVLAAGDKYRDRAALWCVQTGEEGAAFYKGDLSKRLFVKNHPAMPYFTGSKHANCADMLLKIESARMTAVGGVVTVRFLYKFE